MSPPRLIIVRGDNSTSDMDGFILADGVSVPISKATPCQLILDLLGAYYAWDLSFPKRYQILSFLQVYLLKDLKNSVYRGAALTKLEKKYIDL